MSRYLGALAVLGWGLFGFYEAQALSVGDAVVQSSLGQPLRVTIPIALESPAEIESANTLRVAFEPNSTYVAQGLEGVQFPPDFLTVSVAPAGGSQQLLLTSRQPFLEPVGTLLLRVSLGNISIIHQLPLLLDPPSSSARTVVAVSAQRLAGAVPASIPDALSQPILGTRVPTPAASVEVSASEALPLVPAEKKPRLSKARQAQKAGLSLGGVAPAPPGQQAVVRFQLDYRFGTYALLKSQGLLPQPVSSAAPLPPAKPVDVAVIAPIAAAVASPMTGDALGTGQAKTDGEPGTGFAWWLALLVVPLFAWLLRSRMSDQGVPRPLWFAVKRKASTSPVNFRTRDLPVRPARKAEESDSERSAREDFIDDAASKPAVVLALPAANQLQPIVGGDIALSSLRRRAQDLSKRTLTAEVRSRLMIVEAHLDLRRITAAISLLEELERVSEKPKTSTRLMV